MVKKKYILERASFFGAKVLKRLPIPHELKYKYNQIRHKKVEKILLPYFKSAEKVVITNNYSHKNDGPIWLFWWQGEDRMPPIVKRCLNSVKRNANGRKVILITKNNLKDYLQLSSRLIKLNETHKIPMAHFSDVIRFNLLKNYGGLWLDATILVTKQISSDYFTNFFTCSGYKSEDYFFVTNGNWCSFLIGGSANHPVFQFMSAFYSDYWNKNDRLVDYFIIDYALKYAWQRNWGDFKTYTETHKKKKNPHMFDLVNKLNQKYDSKEWAKLNQNTEMFKLTYKMHFLQKKNTFYDFIMDID